MQIFHKNNVSVIICVGVGDKWAISSDTVCYKQLMILVSTQVACSLKLVLKFLVALLMKPISCLKQNLAKEKSKILKYLVETEINVVVRWVKSLFLTKKLN